MTIVEALKEVMRGAGRALSSREAYDEIVAQGLYQFQAKDGMSCATTGWLLRPIKAPQRVGG